MAFDELSSEDFDLMKPDQTLIDRKCLACSKHFKARGNTNRICARCKKLNENMSSEEELRVGR